MTPSESRTVFADDDVAGSVMAGRVLGFESGARRPLFAVTRFTIVAGLAESGTFVVGIRDIGMGLAPGSVVCPRNGR